MQIYTITDAGWDCSPVLFLSCCLQSAPWYIHQYQPHLKPRQERPRRQHKPFSSASHGATGSETKRSMLPLLFLNSPVFPPFTPRRACRPHLPHEAQTSVLQRHSPGWVLLQKLLQTATPGKGTPALNPASAPLQNFYSQMCIFKHCGISYHKQISLSDEVTLCPSYRKQHRDGFTPAATPPDFSSTSGWFCTRDPLKQNAFQTKYGPKLARSSLSDPIFNPYSNNQRNRLVELSLFDPETGNIFSAQFTQSRVDQQRFPCSFFFVLPLSCQKVSGYLCLKVKRTNI